MIENALFQGLEIIPSENYTSTSVLEVVGSPMNHNSEGLPGQRYYSRNKYVTPLSLIMIHLYLS